MCAQRASLDCGRCFGPACRPMARSGCFMSTRTLLLCRPVKPQTRVAACPFRCIVSRAAGACRLQTGMRGAFGKPQGWVARCMINQIIYSVRTKPAFEGAAHEALRRAKFKIPGRQYVVTSTKHGFTEIEKSEDTITKNSRYNLSYSQLKEKKLLVKVRRFAVLPSLAPPRLS